MSRAWKTRLFMTTAVLSTGLALVAAGFVSAPMWGSLFRSAEAIAKESDLHNKAPARKQVPLDCRVELFRKAEQRAFLAPTWGFQTHPDLLTPRILRNPLFADAVRIEIENTSSHDFGIYSWSGDEPRFWITIRIEDAAGQPVLFPHAGPSGIKRLGVAPLKTPILALKPGQVVTQRSGIWNYLNARDLPKPGRYTVRVIGSYYRVPDGRDCQVEAEPFKVTITKRDIREWRETHEAFHSDFEEVVPGPPPPPPPPPHP